MKTALQLLLVPTLLVLGWILARRCQWGPVIQRIATGGVVAGVLVLLVSGLLIDVHSVVHATHRWTAHLLVIWMWTFGLLSIGARYGEGWGDWKFELLIVCLGGSLLVTSFTGYLGPRTAAEYGEELLEETKNRFIVLHMFVLPGVVGALATCWTYLAWARERRSS